MTVRVLTASDAGDCIQLYRDLTVGPSPTDEKLFSKVIQHPGTQVYGKVVDGCVVAMATLHILPNVTWGGRPYALVENVVTAAKHRGNGFGRETLEAARDAAWAQDCYKIMLLTGQGRNATGFYESVGFSRDNKFGMIIRRD